MYTMKVPYKDFKDNPRNGVAHFNLAEREVFKLLVEFQAIFGWLESIESDEKRELDSAEVVQYYTNFEEILLSAYGEPSDDGEYFRKGARRFDFEESAIFAAIMVECVSDPRKTSELIDGLMPKDLQALVKKADANLAELAKDEKINNPALQEEIAKLRAELAAKEQSVGSN